ncbi:glycoside hydrolase family 27 protein [Aquibacillus koreensis]|uniref:Alpha-galactosidase n=1 Tax=Aquibacillus koreensis TaxID=279446 RepID=A0A9X3WKA9_9BACI|nr:glycoside hydrolase family 27 protein [Aquibacillus koreensis]MCT2535977.1 glycoside hydrolase family 27 protein [Aquibacillus koreensis]MDC3420433.1 glycoside hydrolase family 27 protein [Aquibacillus koreensis]
MGIEANKGKTVSVAQAPPMGWNSWDCYGATVTEEEVKANADYMAKHLKDFGWEYIVVDIQWYEPEANSSIYRPFADLEMDEYSRLVPASNRFPSGFKKLADYVHGLGLKFGIHIMRGIPRQAVHANTAIYGTTLRARDIAHTNSICPWNTDMYGVDATKEGAQDYYNSLFELYASWGVDFVKVDDIAASRLYDAHLDEIELIHNAIDHCGREIVLSLSPGPAPIEYAEQLNQHANMWRMTDDFWDKWEHLYQMFDRCEIWSEHVQPGNWPDCDMLPLGHIGIRSVDGDGSNRYTRFSKDEQVTMMTLWSIFKSPLMFGGELNDNDAWTNSLITNKEVLAMHRDCYNPKLVQRDHDKIVWMTQNNRGEIYVALFNASETDCEVSISLHQLGISSEKNARDLWAKEELGTITKTLSKYIPKHGANLIKLY